MASLKTPIIVTVIGEGGSGGALAIAVGDVVLMLQYATYSVISPEGCASILWKSADKAPEAAETLGITASRLKTLGLIDKIVTEPLGGAHRDPQATAAALKKALAEALQAAAGEETEGAGRGAPRAPDGLWPLQGNRRALARRAGVAVAPRACAASASRSGCRAASIRSCCCMSCMASRRSFGYKLSAIHVNHGLSPNAGDWQKFCSAFCLELGVPFKAVKVKVKKQRHGLEAAAREARRAAFSKRARRTPSRSRTTSTTRPKPSCSTCCAATGLAGASGMPVQGRLGRKMLLRPLLDVPRSAIRAYAAEHRLGWIEDESNADESLTRNFIRRRVGPLLEARFPRWRENLARAARHFAGAELDARRLLRAYLKGKGLRAPSEAKLRRNAEAAGFEERAKIGARRRRPARLQEKGSS